MKGQMPLDVHVQGMEKVVVITEAWNTTKNWSFGIAIFSLIALFMLIGYEIGKGGAMAVLPWFAAIAGLIGTIAFGGRWMLRQPTGLSKFGAVMILLAIVAGLLLAGLGLQKLIVSSPAPAAMTGLPTTSAPPPQAPETPSQAQVTVNIPDRVHVDAVVEQKPAAQPVQPVQPATPTDPTANMTPEERRRYNILVLGKEE